MKSEAPGKGGKGKERPSTTYNEEEGGRKDTGTMDVEEMFDHVIVASQAHTALQLVTDLTLEESNALATFSYESSEVSVHRDSHLFMPHDQRDWTAMNIVLPRDRSKTQFTMYVAAASEAWKEEEKAEGEEKTAQSRRSLFQTWNPMSTPRREAKR